MPPAALISLTASFAPLAAGRSSADSSPVSAKPPPILIVPPLAGALPAALPAAVGAALVPVPVVAGALEPPELLHAATSASTAASTNPRASWVRIMPPPPLQGPLVSEPRQCSAGFRRRTTPVAVGEGPVGAPSRRWCGTVLA